MMNLVLPDIPRGYTALAEWLACMIYILPLNKRIKGGRLGAILAAAGGVQYLLQLGAGKLPLEFWVLGMAANVFCMVLTIYVCCSVTAKGAVYWGARAFITAEFAAALEWQIYAYLTWPHKIWGGLYRFLLLAAVYGIVFTCSCIIEKRITTPAIGMEVKGKEAVNAVMMGIVVFIMSNIGFILNGNLLGRENGIILFYIRTLVNFCGICILYIQQNQKYEMGLKQELGAINNMFELQYEQYLAYKESSDTIRRKYHDLKYQIDAIRSEPNEERRDNYLRELEKAVINFRVDIVTGNGVLDTILTRKNAYCVQNGISFTCIAEGELLNFMDTMDICTVFGNALDNSIECVEKCMEHEKRIIRLRVYRQNRLLMIQVDNYYDGELIKNNAIPETTKKGNREDHGYGLKSILYTIEKYNGSMTIHTENHWFELRMLLPIET